MVDLARTRPVVLASALVLAATTAARADPRWWWDDAPVGGGGPASDLDLDAVGGTNWPSAVFVAWVEPPQAFEGALLLSASFDGGCSFCPPVLLRNVFDPADEVDLAVAPRQDSVDSAYVIQVAHASRGRLEVLHDARTVPVWADPATRCAALLELNRTMEVTVLASEGADGPDLEAVHEMIDDGSLARFHAAWRSTGLLGEQSIDHARDASGEGTWEVLGELAPPGAPLDGVASPHVTLDWLADTGVAVDVAWTRPGLGEVLYLRSADGGDTFSATGAPPAGAPATVNTPVPGNTTGPIALDSGARPSTGEPGPWHGVLWYQDVGPTFELLFDAQHQDTPTAPDVGWAADTGLGFAGGNRAEGLAVSILPAPDGGGPSPLFLFWTVTTGLSGSEVFVRPGSLDEALAVPIDLTRHPFPWVRPGDPVIAENGRLTYCAIDELSGECVPGRSSGGAHRVVSDEADGVVHVAWIDDRDGTPRIWTKRTDRSVEGPVPELTVSCPTPDERRVTVTFAQVPGCRSSPAVPEKIRRYLVYYGRDPGGPYDNIDRDGTIPGVPDTVVIEDDGTLGDPISVDVDGLAAATSYWFIVVPVDEAGNWDPPDFDPLADGASSPRNERRIDTPASCDPCPPFRFDGAVTATPGDCTVALSWPAASGAPPVFYEVRKDGLTAARDLDTTSWIDREVSHGVTATYEVLARDSCASPGPRGGGLPPTAGVGPDDATPPVIEAAAPRAVSPCRLQVEGSVTDACAASVVVTLLRDGEVVATGAGLPLEDVVPADGAYAHVVRAVDTNGNESEVALGTTEVTGCSCLFRATAPSLDAAGLFVRPRRGDDIAFAPPADMPHGPCPFASGALDPDPILAPGAPPLAFYQVAGRSVILRVTADRAARSVRIEF